MDGRRQTAQPEPLARTRHYAVSEPLTPRSRPSPGPPSPPASIPANHNIFDFLNRDLRTYAPELSSAKVRRHPLSANLEVAHPALRRLRRNAPQKRAILEDPRPQRHPQHHPARPRHLPARILQRTPAIRHVHTRPARHAGHILLVHHPPSLRCLRRRSPSALASCSRFLQWFTPRTRQHNRRVHNCHSTRCDRYPRPRHSGPDLYPAPRRIHALDSSALLGQSSPQSAASSASC